jgi:ribokinase
MAKVIVFGSLNMDMFLDVKRIPRKGETVVCARSVTMPGGKGANQAVMSASMGAQTYLVGRVGTDPFNHVVLKALQGRGVNTVHVTCDPKASTGTAIILRERDDNRIIVEPGANLKTPLSEVKAALDALAQKDAFFVTQLECGYDVTMEALLYAKKLGMHTVCNAAPAVALTDEAYAALDILCVNETEAEEIVGFPVDSEDACFRALEFFAEKGVKDSVITLGEEGSVTLADGVLVKVAAYDVEYVDTTGAGDAYLGALVAQLGFGSDLIEAMAYATAASALTVCEEGAQQAMPSRADVEAFIAKEGLNA